MGYISYNPVKITGCSCKSRNVVPEQIHGPDLGALGGHAPREGDGHGLDQEFSVA
jgi:hypothetical protein